MSTIDISNTEPQPLQGKTSGRSKKKTDKTSTETSSPPLGECMVCMSSYTNKLKTPVECAFCKFAYCRPCVRQFLVTKSQPHCMRCNAVWSDDFLETIFSPSWLDGAYREHLDQVLLEQEKSMLITASQELYRREMQRKRESLQMNFNLSSNRLEDERARVQRQMVTLEGLQRQKETEDKRRATLEFISNTSRQEYESLLRQIRNIEQSITMYRNSISGLEKKVEQLMQDVEEFNQHSDEKLEVNAVSIRCPKPSCQGFLTSTYFCPVCKVYHCRECHVAVGPQPLKASDTSHKCDQDLVKTIKAIAKDSKPCPSCKMPIMKLEGCNQMFCTNCHTGFNWLTGEVDKGRIHNPHYFEWVRKTGGDQRNASGGANQPIEAGRGQGDCRITMAELSLIEAKKGEKNHHDEQITSVIFKGLRLLWHIETIINDHPLPAYANRHLNLRIQYVSSSGKMTEDEWKKKLSKDDKIYRQNIKKRQIQETLMLVLQDIYLRYKNDPDYYDCRGDVMGVIDYYNEACKKLARRLNHRTYEGIERSSLEEREMPLVEIESPVQFKTELNAYEDVAKPKMMTSPSWLDEEEKQYFETFQYYDDLYREVFEVGSGLNHQKAFTWEFIQKWSHNQEMNVRIILFDDLITKRVRLQSKQRIDVLQSIGKMIYGRHMEIWLKMMNASLRLTDIAYSIKVPNSVLHVNPKLPSQMCICGWAVPFFSNVLFPYSICENPISISDIMYSQGERKNLIFRNFIGEEDRDYMHHLENYNSKEFLHYQSMTTLYLKNLSHHIEEYRTVLTTAQLWRVIYRKMRHWLLPLDHRLASHEIRESSRRLLDSLYNELATSPTYTRSAAVKGEWQRICSFSHL